MDNIKPIHSCFIQLNHIMHRLFWSNIFEEETNKELLNIRGKPDQGKAWKKIQAQNTMNIDYILLNLSQLLEIHDSQLGKALEEIGNRELLKCLDGLWNPIKELKEKIELWRNSYIAHSRDQANNFHILKEIDSNYIDTIKKACFASRLAVRYISTIFTNNLSDYQWAISQQIMRMESLGKEEFDNPHLYWEEMKVREDELIKKTNEILRKNGYEDVSLPINFLNPK